MLKVYAAEPISPIIRVMNKNLNVFDFPADANLYACDGLDENGNPTRRHNFIRGKKVKLNR